MSSVPTAKPPSPAFFTWRLMRYRPGLYALVSLGWILYHVWPLLPGLLAKAFFDTITGVTNTLTLWQIVVLAVLLGLGRGGILLATALTGPRWVMAVGGLLQRNMLAAILKRPGAESLLESAGATLSTMRDDVEMMRLAMDWWFDALAGLLLAAGGLAILLTVDVRITLLVFVPLVVVILLVSAARTRLEQAREHSREATASVTGAIGEIFRAVQAIQVAGAEQRVVAHLRHLGMRRRNLVLRDRFQSLALDGTFAATASIGAGLTLIVAAEQIQSGAFSIGDFALFAAYLMQVAEYTGFLGYLLRTYRQVGVSFGRGVRVLQGAPPAALVEHHALPLNTRTIAPQAHPLQKTAGDRLETLELRDLTLRHAGGGGIEHLSLALRRGQVVAVTGRMGSGKTTLLRGMLGLLDLQHGTVRWNGRAVHDLAAWMQPPRVAYTAQVPALISGSVRENVLLGLACDDSRIQVALRQAVFEGEVAGLANQLDTPIGAGGVRLSGGQAQRLAAARMLVRQPELLVIDDLSSALDYDTEQQLWRRMATEDSAAPAILAVSYRRGLLERADEIIVLEEGRVAARGTFTALQESSALFRSIVQGRSGQESQTGATQSDAGLEERAGH